MQWTETPQCVQRRGIHRCIYLHQDIHNMDRHTDTVRHLSAGVRACIFPSRRHGRQAGRQHHQVCVRMSHLPASHSGWLAATCRQAGHLHTPTRTHSTTRTRNTDTRQGYIATEVEIT